MKRDTRDNPRRYLGMELAGAKNQKTTLAALEYYPREQKIFLLDIYDRITPKDDQSSDEALIELIDELRGSPHELALMGVNVPLTLPPCVSCLRKTCPQPVKCTVPSVRWMREATRKAARSGRAESEGIRIRDFTPYTQRPSELWLRYSVMPEIDPGYRFEIDEALGGTKAPLSLRMQFLKRHLGEVPMIEAWPKLSIAMLAGRLNLPKRILQSYRRLEEGVHARSDILNAIASHFGVFIYDRDLKKLALSLSAFDAFVCAYTALLSDSDRCAKVPSGFPAASGWVQYPRP